MQLDLDTLPLSQTRRGQGLIFVAGQLPIDSLGIVRRGDIRDQTRLVLANLERALDAEGTDLKSVVKVNVWLSSPDLSQGFNEVYRDFFEKPFPVRTTVVAQLLVPADIELDAIALASQG